MKVNFQKIIVVCVSVCICISLLVVNVYADDYSGITEIVQNDVDCITSVLNVVKDVLSGEKSVQEGYSAIQAIGNRVVKQNVKEVLTLPYNSETELNGVTPRDFADKITTNVRKGLRDMGGDITENTITTDNIDTKGAGAVLYMPNVNGREYEIYYMNYGEFYYNGSDLYFSTNGMFKRTLKSYGGDPVTSDYLENRTGLASDSFKYYGDWRYREDGSPASDKTSPVQSTFQVIDTSQMSDSDLIELLQDMINKLNIEFPDLSTIEGLLSAIYNRLGTLDSDNDNELLSQILTAIQALQGSGGDNAEIINSLDDIKNNLVYNDGDNIQTLAEQLKELIDNQLTSDDFTIDEDAFNQRGEVLKLRLFGKFGFIESLKNLISYMMNSYSSSSELPTLTLKIFDTSAEMNFSWLSEHLPLFQAILAAYIYISYAFHTYRKIPSYINGGDNE